MKKIALTVVAMMSMTMAFAANGDGNTNKGEKSPEVEAVDMTHNYDMSVNYRSLASALGLNEYQQQAVALIHNKFVDEVKEARHAGAATRQNMVKQAADKELQYMSYVLDNKQYNKFARLLNLTLSNRGLTD